MHELTGHEVLVVCGFDAARLAALNQTVLSDNALADLGAADGIARDRYGLAYAAVPGDVVAVADLVGAAEVVLNVIAGVGKMRLDDVTCGALPFMSACARPDRVGLQGLSGRCEPLRCRSRRRRTRHWQRRQSRTRA